MKLRDKMVAHLIAIALNIAGIAKHALHGVVLSYANPLSNSLPQAGERVIVPSPVNGRGLGRGQLTQLNCHAAGKSKTICFVIYDLRY